MLNKAIELAKGNEEPKVGLSVQVPKSLKDEFENICKENNVSMSSMLLSLIQVAVDEIDEKENVILDINKSLLSIISEKEMLQKIYDQTGENELELTDGTVKYLKKDLDSLNHRIKSLEVELGHLMSMKGGIER